MVLSSILTSAKSRLKRSEPESKTAPSAPRAAQALPPKFSPNNSSKSSELLSPSGGSSTSATATTEYSVEPSSPVLKVPSRASQSTQGSPRRLSDKMKATPSTLHRQSRIYSGTSEHSVSPTLTSHSHAVATRQVTERLAPALRPVVTLLQAQRLRVYNTGVFEVPGHSEDGRRVWIEVEAKLTGNELAIWRPSDDELDLSFTEFKPKYVNIIDSRIEIVGAGDSFELRIVNDYSEENNILIRVAQVNDYVKWLAALYLANYEYVSLNEAFTAVILSSRGAQLSDIHVLLAQKKRFPTEEWCNLRLPQISNKWIKVFVVTTPGDSKRMGRIEIYSTDKISKRNLILYVSKLDHVYNVYPESPNMIDFNAIMKLQGEVWVNKSFEYLFGDVEVAAPRQMFKSISRSDSWHSLSSLKRSGSGNVRVPSSPKSTVDSSTGASSTSFFANAPSPKPSTSNRRRSRTIDLVKHEDSDMQRTSSFVKKNLDHFATTSYMYLMPLTHPGVPAIETMIRNLIHIIDSFKLYGRPRHLISDKSNVKSFLFGLPALPHYQYFSRANVTKFVDRKLNQAVNEKWSERQWHQEFKQELKTKMDTQGYKGHGDVTKLYQNLDYSVFGDMPASPVLPEDGYSDGDYTLSPPSYSRSSTPVGANDFLAAPISFDRSYTASPLGKV